MRMLAELWKKNSKCRHHLHPLCVCGLPKYLSLGFFTNTEVNGGEKECKPWTRKSLRNVIIVMVRVSSLGCLLNYQRLNPSTTSDFQKQRKGSGWRARTPNPRAGRAEFLDGNCRESSKGFAEQKTQQQLRPFWFLLKCQSLSNLNPQVLENWGRTWNSNPTALKWLGICKKDEEVTSVCVCGGRGLV